MCIRDRYAPGHQQLTANIHLNSFMATERAYVRNPTYLASIPHITRSGKRERLGLLSESSSTLWIYWLKSAAFFFQSSFVTALFIACFLCKAKISLSFT